MNLPRTSSLCARLAVICVLACSVMATTPPSVAGASTLVASTVTLSSSANPASVGDSVTLTASVAGSGGTPTGTVTFDDGSAAIGSGSVNGNGQATLVTSSLAAGSHPITALYGGDATFAASSSPVFAQMMRSTTTLAVTTSGSPSTYGSPVTFTATLTTNDSVVPTGLVTFSDGGTPIGSGSIGAAGFGMASYTTAALAGGPPHIISAAYAGDNTHAPSVTTASATQSVTVQSTTLAVSITPNPAATGQLVTIAATVAPSAPSMTYSYTSDPGDYIGQGQSRQYSSAETTISTTSSTSSSLNAWVNGRGDDWSIDIHAPQGQTLAVGTYTGAERAAFASPGAPGLDVFGDGRGCNQVGGDFTINWIDATPGGALRGVDVTFNQHCENGPSALHGHLHVTGTVTPTGTVTFLDGASPIGSASVNSFQSATFATSALNAGSHSLGAIYSGDGGYGGATGPGVSESVVQPVAAVTLASSNNPAIPGQQVTLTAGVTGSGVSAPTGTVTFEDGSTPLGSGTIDGSGHASIATTLSTGVHTLIAVYGGDGSYHPASSAPLPQTVAQPAAAMSLGSSANPSTSGDGLTLGATLTWTQAFAVPTGTVTFSEGSAVLGTAPVDGSGSASLTISSLPIGHHSLTATYGGDSLYASTSAGLTQTVRPADKVDVWISSDPSVPGQTVTYLVTVVTADHGTPTGTVTVWDGAAPLGAGTLDADGSFVFSTSSLASGSHNLAFSYGGDANYGQASAAVTQTVASATADQRFVNQLYNDILNRSADAGATSLATALQAGKVDRTHVTLSLTTSTEYISDEVQASYLIHLGRDADPNGLGYWVDYIRKGATVEDLETSFLGTAEYYGNAGGTNDGLLTALYRDVFGRDIDPDGRKYWDDRLAHGLSPWQVAASLVKSTEAMSNRVTGYYWLLLGRAPDAKGLSAWVALLQRGTRDENLLAQLAASNEYWNDTQAY